MIVGLGGYGGSGKDTIAEYLARVHGFARVAIADPIRRVAQKINPIIDPPLHRLNHEVNLSGWRRAKERYEVRRVLVQVGSALRAEFGEEFLIERVQSQILTAKLLDLDRDWVVSDLRFYNEFDALRRMGAHLIRVERPGLTPSEADEHLDEADWDFIIENSGTVEDLEDVVSAFLAGCKRAGDE